MDATKVDDLGMYVNDCAPQHANVKMRMLIHNGKPYLYASSHVWKVFHQGQSCGEKCKNILILQHC